MLKEYTKPIVSRVSLIPSEALLYSCKTSQNLSDCATSVGIDGCEAWSCYSDGS